MCIKTQCCNSTGHTSHSFSAYTLLREILFYNCSKRAGFELWELKISKALVSGEHWTNLRIYSIIRLSNRKEKQLDSNKMTLFHDTYIPAHALSARLYSYLGWCKHADITCTSTAGCGGGGWNSTPRLKYSNMVNSHSWMIMRMYSWQVLGGNHKENASCLFAVRMHWPSDLLSTWSYSAA